MSEKSTSLLKKYRNGNAEITILQDGTRTIEYEGDLNLDFPLNLDIRVSNKCSFGQRPDGTYVLCNFCHESAKTDGSECDYQQLKDKLRGLPEGIEIAIGSNEFTTELWYFLEWCKIQGYICNLTINQGHIKRDLHNILWSNPADIVKGLGISYRNSLRFDVPRPILDNPNTVFHVIMGIDTIQQVMDLRNEGVKKILILGEKSFGFNENRVNLSSQIHKEWYWWVRKLFDLFEVVSFDNLALEQLNLKRFFPEKSWETFYNGEHSFYIDAVSQTFAPSSRNPDKKSWENLSIQDYFKTLNK